MLPLLLLTCRLQHPLSIQIPDCGEGDSLGAQASVQQDGALCHDLCL